LRTIGADRKLQPGILTIRWPASAKLPNWGDGRLLAKKLWTFSPSSGHAVLPQKPTKRDGGGSNEGQVISWIGTRISPQYLSSIQDRSLIVWLRVSEHQKAVTAKGSQASTPRSTPEIRRLESSLGPPGDEIGGAMSVEAPQAVLYPAMRGSGEPANSGGGWRWQEDDFAKRKTETRRRNQLTTGLLSFGFLNPSPSAIIMSIRRSRVCSR